MVIVLLITALEGCISAKKLTYFQGATQSEDTIAIPKPYIPTVRRGDILSIQVSSLNAEASGFFNPVSMAVTATNNAVANPLAPNSGYLVAEDGTIKYPILGKITVSDLTTTQVGDLLGDRLKTYLKEPTVNVRNLNFRISVLGEVARPSLFTISNERITIPEALGLAGDLTIFGRRDNVLIIREDGQKRLFARIDLTRRGAFQSPYYALRPNDIVYVEPGKARVTSVDRAYQLAPIITGLLSIIAIIATRVR